MSKLLRRLSLVIRASRAGRGDELDRVISAIEEGARFEGAAGVMLLALAKDGGRCEHAMRGAGSRYMITDELLGAAYARKVKAYIRRTKGTDPFRIEDGK
ncbi:hypothetical protein [Halomonas sp. Mc5H-6]|jgi:hypothetical protein|uniref:hypothetical protein n=1 Tax=Halomonas sp. Mc5H-6 TaxID=2954500 RepID=UPI002097652F|nr:hypothetical protein [Halomonas sp. Mc5H-6]MCO7246400.1 hypothetical protein [Halomonas sp. Mc5H-6]